MVTKERKRDYRERYLETALNHLKAVMDAVPSGIHDLGSLGACCPFCSEDAAPVYARAGYEIGYRAQHDTTCPYIKAKTFLKRHGIEVSKIVLERNA